MHLHVIRHKTQSIQRKKNTQTECSKRQMFRTNFWFSEVQAVGKYCVQPHWQTFQILFSADTLQASRCLFCFSIYVSFCCILDQQLSLLPLFHSAVFSLFFSLSLLPFPLISLSHLKPNFLSFIPFFVSLESSSTTCTYNYAVDATHNVSRFRHTSETNTPAFTVIYTYSLRNSGVGLDLFKCSESIQSALNV